MIGLVCYRLIRMLPSLWTFRISAQHNNYVHLDVSEAVSGQSACDQSVYDHTGFTTHARSVHNMKEVCL